jgi:hypothetical protein
MIDFKKLKFGDKVYVVNEKNNVVKQKRIFMTDSEGVEWHRYDRENLEYDIEVIEYCGKVTYMPEGRVRFDEDGLDEYHFEHPDGQIYGEDDGADEYYLDNWFNSEEEAVDHITQLKAERAGNA